ncbi:MAG: hypothetical protein ABJ215_06745 [Alphaproteobacteria bacterium]
MAKHDLKSAAEIRKRFIDAGSNNQIVAARWKVLDEALATYVAVGTYLAVDSVVNDEKQDCSRALVLLCRICSELFGTVANEIRSDRFYSASVVLRQIVEVEYLMFMGYLDIKNLEMWLHADGETLRKEFTPQRMRKRSDGLFSDREYWTHCDIGGHPNPKARLMLAGYSHVMPPVASLLPDSIHHVVRLWTSTRFVLEDLLGDRINSISSCETFDVAIEEWRSREDGLVLSYDGISQNQN